MAALARTGKRNASEGSAGHTLSCGPCYKRKVKCDRALPCSYCCERGIECVPSPIATTNRPRKRRFPEAELLARIRKYEAALLSYGADLEAIQRSDVEGLQPLFGASLASPACDNAAAATSRYSSDHEMEENSHVLTILDGDEHRRSKDDPAGQKWYDRIFAFDADTSSFLFAVDPGKLPAHPAPFDMFKLWQIYCDNFHPVNKILHAPTFQRKMSAYGAHLHLAPPSDQALFFAVYVAAITTLSSGECEAIFFTNREELLSQYKLATQVWLRRAGLWRTSELSVLQAFILFLSSIQNVVEPRSVSCFTGVADRIARRLGLHRAASHSKMSPVEQEVRKRVWWELVLLDARVLEKIGIGSSSIASDWNARLPSGLSDADLDSLQRPLSNPSTQPSSEMIFFLVRVEGAHFLARTRNQKGTQKSSGEVGRLERKLHMIDDFERRLQSRLLCYCDTALPLHRMAIMLAQLVISRLRMSIHAVEESTCRGESQRAAVGLQFLQHCSFNLNSYNDMREDASLTCFKWFMLQNLPIVGYIHILRLLQIHTFGSAVDQAWEAVRRFRSTGVRLVVDSLTMKAWKARIAASPNTYIEEPPFIQEINQRRLAAATTDMLPHLKGIDTAIQSSDTPSEADFMAMLDDILSGEMSNEFDWLPWISGQ